MTPWKGVGDGLRRVDKESTPGLLPPRLYGCDKRRKRVLVRFVNQVKGGRKVFIYFGTKFSTSFFYFSVTLTGVEDGRGESTVVGMTPEVIGNSNIDYLKKRRHH